MPIDTRHDRHDMASVLRGTPDQIEFAIGDPDFPAIARRRVARVVVAGMGGSALPVEVLRAAFAGRLRAPVEAVRSYALPAPPDADTLVIASSFSGTTEETLSCLEGLPAGFDNAVAISAGGTLREAAAARGLPWVRVPKEREPDSFQPRCATGYFVTYLARVLADAGVLDDPAGDFGKLAAFLRGIDPRPEAEALAHAIRDEIPVVYTDDAWADSIARICKIKLNENAKRPAFFAAIPESSHNEMIGYTSALGRFAYVYLRDPASHPRIDQRYAAARALFAERGMDHVSFHDWTLPGSARLEKIFAGLAFGDWLAYGLALLAGIDPTPVELVEEFKQRLARGDSAGG